MWYNTVITQILGIDFPVMQGPFGGNLSSVALLAAVSNAGGLGGYGAYTLRPEEIIELNKNIRAATDKPFNINLWVDDRDAGVDTVTDEQFERVISLFRPYFDEAGIALPQKPAPFTSRFPNQVQVILDTRPPVFSFVFGIPDAAVLDQCRKRGIKTAGAATTVDEALALEAAGVDIIIASGFEAGGHRPSFLAAAEQSLTGSFVLTQLIKEKVRTPVVSAGGIANGRGIAAALTLGADGVQIGTAFLACDESGATDLHRERMFSDAAKYTTLTRAYTGRLGRGIASRITKELQGKEKEFLPFPLQTSFMSSLRQAAIDQQRHEMVLFWSGQIAPVLKHRNASLLMKSLVTETTQLLAL